MHGRQKANSHSLVLLLTMPLSRPSFEVPNRPNGSARDLENRPPCQTPRQKTGFSWDAHQRGQSRASRWEVRSNWLNRNMSKDTRCRDRRTNAPRWCVVVRPQSAIQRLRPKHMPRNASTQAPRSQLCQQTQKGALGGNADPV